MQVWIVCFVVFFAAAELYQWLQGMTLPMPVFVIAGALLAVASNTQTLRKQNSLQPVPSAPKTMLPQPAPRAWSNPEALSITATASPRYYPGVQLPDLKPQSGLQSGRSISFTLQNPNPVSAAENLGKDKD